MPAEEKMKTLFKKIITFIYFAKTAIIEQVFSIFTVFFMFLVSIVLFGTFVSCSKTQKVDSAVRQKKVIVYVYDSFASEWGAAPVLKKAFETTSNYEVEFVSVGDARDVIRRAYLEKKAPIADVLLGIDNHIAQEVEGYGILQPYKPEDSDVILPFVHFSQFLQNQEQSTLTEKNEWLITPYDWGYFAFIYDTESKIKKPQSLSELTNEIYRKKIIIMDPRTSTPGLGFVAWTYAIFGEEGYEDFWHSFKSSVLTMAPSWDSGYNLFLEGEAPFVISYSTSPAYHIVSENTHRYVALFFDEGHIAQVEGAGLVSGCPNVEGGKAFLDFLISKEAQKHIPLTQWMYPVNKDVDLPASFALPPMNDTEKDKSREAKTQTKLNVSGKKALEVADRVIQILNER